MCSVIEVLSTTTTKPSPFVLNVYRQDRIGSSNHSETNLYNQYLLISMMEDMFIQLLVLLWCSPGHIYLEIDITAFNRAYSQVSVYRIAVLNICVHISIRFYKDNFHRKKERKTNVALYHSC